MNKNKKLFRINKKHIINNLIPWELHREIVILWRLRSRNVNYSIKNNILSVQGRKAGINYCASVNWGCEYCPAYYIIDVALKSNKIPYHVCPVTFYSDFANEMDAERKKHIAKVIYRFFAFLTQFYFIQAKRDYRVYYNKAFDSLTTMREIQKLNKVYSNEKF